MSERARSASPEVYFVGSALVGVMLAAILSQIPGLAFGSFVTMAAILVAADVVLYAAMKLGLIKLPRAR